MKQISHQPVAFSTIEDSIRKGFEGVVKVHHSVRGNQVTFNIPVPPSNIMHSSVIYGNMDLNTEYGNQAVNTEKWALIRIS